MPQKKETWRITLIWPAHATIQSRKNEDGQRVRFGREVFPNCTDVINLNGQISFTDATGKRKFARLLYFVEEE